MGLNKVLLTSSTTWTAPVGVTEVLLIGSGGGGGGGAGKSGSNNPAIKNVGGGGGAGAIVSNVIASVTAGGNYSVIIGEGGVGGTFVNTLDAPGNNGSPGGITSFGSSATFLGSSGGQGGGQGSNGEGSGGRFATKEGANLYSPFVIVESVPFVFNDDMANGGTSYGALNDSTTVISSSGVSNIVSLGTTTIPGLGGLQGTSFDGFLAGGGGSGGGAGPAGNGADGGNGGAGNDPFPFVNLPYAPTDGSSAASNSGAGGGGGGAGGNGQFIEKIHGANGGTGGSGFLYIIWADSSGGGGTGTTGPQGPQGSPGVTGPQGATGAHGATGSAGATGAQGATGPQGAAGAQGATGPTGPAGANGATGPTGPQGSQGIQGVTGATGPTGPQGAAGPQGATGPTGPQGAQGSPGVTGATGPTGPQGATGPTGPQGATGLQGATGPTGPQGATGPAGATGAGSDIIFANDLAGSTSTSQWIAAISGQGSSGTTITLKPRLFQWVNTVTGPTINQAIITTGNGATMTIQAQTATGGTNNGGNLLLSSGNAAAGTPGNINFQIGGSSKMVLDTAGGLLLKKASNNTSTTGDLNFGNGGVVYFRNQANSTDIPALTFDSSNRITIGYGNGFGTSESLNLEAAATQSIKIKTTPTLQFTNNINNPTIKIEAATNGNGSDLFIAAQDGTNGGSANDSGGYVNIRGGSQVGRAIKGGVRLQLNATTESMVETGEVVPGSPFTAFNLGSNITTTQIPTGSGSKVMFIGNATGVPQPTSTTRPVGGGILLGVSGALYWYGVSGTYTLIAPA